MARIPGRFVVHKDLDAAGVRGLADPLRVRVVDRKRLFHHDVDAALCRRLDDRRMVAGVRERRDGLGLDRVEHRREIREERRVGDLVAFCIASQERRVGLEDAHYLHVRSPLRGAKEAAHVSVHEAGNRQPKRRPFLSWYTGQGGDDSGDEGRSKPGTGHGGCLHWTLSAIIH